MIVSERLYLTADDRIVPAGDPDGRWLFAAAGSEIPDAVAAQYGIGEPAEQEPEPAAEPDSPEPTEPAKPKRRRKKR